MGRRFVEAMTDTSLKHKGAVFIDRFHLKANDKHHNDFTVHFMRIERENVNDEPTFQISNK